MNIDKRTVEEEVVKVVKKDKVTIELDPREVSVLWTIALYLQEGDRTLKSVHGSEKHLTEIGQEVMTDLCKGLEPHCPSNEGWVNALI